MAIINGNWIIKYEIAVTGVYRGVCFDFDMNLFDRSESGTKVE